jgi:hypothetical protein
MPAEVEFTEVAAHPKVESVSYAHLSVELGHLYMEDLQRGPAFLDAHFRQVAPWFEAARLSCVDSLGGRTPRISTCFLVDDYFTRLSPPDVVIPQLLESASAAGLRIDYLARESGCARADEVRLAELVAGRLIAEPPPNTNGSRPPPHENGWLTNGERSPCDSAAEAMGIPANWTPPRETAANRHSIFVDIELWDDDGGRRTWSCPFLAAVWQLLRLGLLRHDGRAVAVPQPSSGPWPTDWDRLPAVIALGTGAASFFAYRTCSVLAGRFLSVEHAVRTILSQVSVDAVAGRQALERSRAEGVELPEEIVDRVEYVLTGRTAAWR